MPLHDHPKTGLIVICDFTGGFEAPEMVKRRPVVVVSAKSPGRAGLCTVVALSTKDPDPVMPFHAKLVLDEKLAFPSGQAEMWIKGDMINVVSLRRLDFIRSARAHAGKREYQMTYLSESQMRTVRTCILRSLGMFALTKHL